MNWSRAGEGFISDILNGNFAQELGAAWGLDGGAQMNQRQAQQQQQQQQAPPTSKKTLRNLPTVRVTADDLIEESNKNCCICLEDQNIGATAVKLGCGHIYHPTCLTEWLQKSCMCPICRYELETDDAGYEADRKSRMKKRKLRFRNDELHSKSISKLKELMSELNVSAAGAVDKRELVERLVASNKIDIVEGVPQMEIGRSEMYSKSVHEIKGLLRSFGLPTENVLYKSELIDRLVESGRVVLVDDTVYSSDYKASSAFGEESKRGHDEEKGSRSSASESKSFVPGVSDLDSVKFETDDRIKLSKSLIASLSVGELKMMMKDSGVSYSGCLERADLIERLASSQKFLIIDE